MWLAGWQDQPVSKPSQPSPAQVRDLLHSMDPSLRLIASRPLAGGVSAQLTAIDARLPDGLSDEEVAKWRKHFDTFLTKPPEIAGEIIVRGVENRKPRILVGLDAKYAAFIQRLMPVTYWNWLGRGGKQ